jgi:hypothetical protein
MATPIVTQESSTRRSGAWPRQLAQYFATVLAVNFLGHGIQDVLDPRRR